MVALISETICEHPFARICDRKNHEGMDSPTFCFVSTPTFSSSPARSFRLNEQRKNFPKSHEMSLSGT